MFNKLQMAPLTVATGKIGAKEASRSLKLYKFSKLY